MAPIDASAPVPRFVGPGAFRVIPLSIHVEYDGKVYEQITVQRMTVAQMRAFFEAVKGDDDAKLDCMVDCPPAVLDALFPDDYDLVDEALRDFLPRRLKNAGETAETATAANPIEPPLGTGEGTSVSPPPNSTSKSQT
jgi:hypothetical protein